MGSPMLILTMIVTVSVRHNWCNKQLCGIVHLLVNCNGAKTCVHMLQNCKTHSITITKFSVAAAYVDVQSTLAFNVLQVWFY